jgi:hypothetical protein
VSEGEADAARGTRDPCDAVCEIFLAASVARFRAREKRRRQMLGRAGIAASRSSNDSAG